MIAAPRGIIQPSGRGANDWRSPMSSFAELAYQSGFGNEFATEALPGALPVGRNSPQRCAFGLYAEQLSGTAFTAPRGDNRRTWLYRIRPAAQHRPFARIDNGHVSERQDFARRAGHPQPAALEPAADPGCVRTAGRFRRRPGHHGRQRRPARADGLRHPPVRGQPPDGGPLLLRCRRRAADRAAAGPAAARHRAWGDRSGAAGDRGRPGGASASGSNCPTALHGATFARTSALRSGCRTSGRSAPTDSPTRAATS